MKHSKALIAMALGAGLVLAGSAEAKTLREALVPSSIDSAVLRGAIAPLGNAIGSQVANQIPALSTSAGYTYEWNPELEVLERSAKTFGPLFTERAVTLGRNKFNLNVSYSWIKFDRFAGKDIDELTSNVEIAFVPETGKTQYFGLSRPLTSDPKTLIGDQVNLKLDLEAQLVDFSFTYGLLDQLDVNVDVPVLRTYVRSEIREILPDPRCLGVSGACDAFLGTVGDTTVGGVPGFVELPAQVSRETKLGIGDIHLRAKWAPVAHPVHLAGLLDLALPTGDPANFQGTGNTRLGTTLIGSKDLGSMFEIHSQGGVEFNCNDVGRSQARYAAGVTAQVARPLAFTVDFLGRSEFGAQGRIPNTGRLPAVRTIDGVNTLAQPLSSLDKNENFKGRPLFIDIQRNDILDIAVGGRVAVGDRTMILANVLIPLNQDGLRADFVPTVGVEVNF